MSAWVDMSAPQPASCAASEVGDGLATMDRGSSDVGVRLVVAFKLAKACGELALAALLVVTLASGQADTVREVVDSLSRHVTSAWSLRVSALVARAASPHAVELTIGALLMD